MLLFKNLHQILEILKLRTPIDSQHVKGSQTLLKSLGEYFYQIFLSLSGKLSRKTCLSVTSEILGLFVYTSTADDKYSLRNSQNLQQPQLYLKQNTFFQLLLTF